MKAANADTQGNKIKVNQFLLVSSWRYTTVEIHHRKKTFQNTNSAKQNLQEVVQRVICLILVLT